jgi:hypothetical protein
MTAMFKFAMPKLPRLYIPKVTDEYVYITSLGEMLDWTYFENIPDKYIPKRKISLYKVCEALIDSYGGQEVLRNFLTKEELARDIVLTRKEAEALAKIGLNPIERLLDNDNDNVVAPYSFTAPKGWKAGWKVLNGRHSSHHGSTQYPIKKMVVRKVDYGPLAVFVKYSDAYAFGGRLNVVPCIYKRSKCDYFYSPYGSNRGGPSGKDFADAVICLK